MKVIANHVRANVVAYLALFIALGGTSYAAVTLRNHSILPIKLNKQRFGGYVRAFASVEANGHIDAASPGTSTKAIETGIPGLWIVRWRKQDLTYCSAQAGVRAVPSHGGAGSALASLVPAGARRGEVGITVLDEHGGPAALPFFVDVICPTP
jgi:hypothetical protein